jgi:tRNA(Ile)-lysidine synthase
MWRAVKQKPMTLDMPPLGGEEFATAMSRFGVFASGTQLALAVSGGPDSMALALCMKEWTSSRGITLKAYIVDHALRSESAAEAKTTYDRLKKIDIAADILRWEHKPVLSRLHASARQARYQLMIEACRRDSISALFLAHQKEDQAETILMRLAKGSGIDGLAGIEAESHSGGIRLLRPLLGFSKQQLIATCNAANFDYITDPSNQSDKFARGRLRRVMPLLAEEGLTLDRLIDLGARASDASEALDYATRALLRVATSRDLSGAIRFDLEHLRSAPSAIADRAIAACLQNIHAEDYAPEHVALQRLRENLCAEADMPPRTLHGCLISRTPTQIIIMREVSAIHDAPIIQPGETVAWDGRWSVTLNGTDGAYTIRPLGNPPYELLDKLAPGLRQLVPQGRARASLPALWKDDVLMVIPSLTSTGTSIPATATLLVAAIGR